MSQAPSEESTSPTSPPKRLPSPPAIVGGLFNLLSGTLALLGGFGLRNMELSDPLPFSIVGGLFVAGGLYWLTGILLLVPFREAFFLGRAFLILGAVANLSVLINGSTWLPFELIERYPFVIPIPALILGLSMLEAIVLFWPESEE